IVTHPLLGPQYTPLSLEQIQDAAKLGAYIELVAGNLSRPADRPRVMEVVRTVGSERMFVGSDSGLVGSANHPDALARAAKTLRDAGLTETDLNRMFKDNPARLVKLPVLPSK